MRVMRVMMLSGILVAMGCATVSGGWNTATTKQAATDGCKTHAIPNTLKTIEAAIKGASMPSPNAVLVPASEEAKMQPQTRYLIKTAACGGDGWRVVTLVRSAPPVQDPATGNMGPAKYDVIDVPAAAWNQ